MTGARARKRENKIQKKACSPYHRIQRKKGIFDLREERKSGSLGAGDKRGVSQESAALFGREEAAVLKRMPKKPVAAGRRGDYYTSALRRGILEGDL